MRADGGAQTDGPFGLLVAGIRMSHGDNDTGVRKAPDRVLAAGALRCQRDPPDRAGIGVTHLGAVVCAAAAGAQPRPLEMDTGDDTRPDRFGERAHAGDQRCGRGGDQTGQRRGGAVAQMKPCRRVDLGRFGVRGAPATVHVHVDKTRHHNRSGKIVIDGSWRRAGPAGENLATGGLQPPRPTELPVEPQGARADQGHLPPFSQKCRISSSWRPLVSGAKRYITAKLTAVKSPNTAKEPAPPSVCSIVKKTAATIALPTRLEVSIVLDPKDRNRDGKLSPAYTHTSEPKQKSKPMMNSNTPMKPSTGPIPPWAKPLAKTATSTTPGTSIVAMPDTRIGRRPNLSTRNSAAQTAASPPTCTSAGSTNNAKSPVNPMAANNLGL